MQDSLSSSPPALDPDTQRVTASLDFWKRKLLDLGKRNRALNFKPNKVSTVTVVDEQPAEVFRQLYLLEKTMRFQPAPEKVAGAGAVSPETAEAEDPLLAEGDGEAPESQPVLDFIPYDAAQLDARHRDDVLQTSSPAEKLDRSLLRLEELARSTIEEQGVNALFLALGMLHYKDAKEEGEALLKAPLVLLPVALQRKSARAGFTVRIAEEDPLVNPALAELLRRNWGITLPELPDLADIATDYDLQTWFQAASAAVSSQQGWAVKTEIHLGLFSFQKLVMYKDLETNSAPFAVHPSIRRLVVRTGEPVLGLPDEVRGLDLDRDLAPESSFQVVDADASQLRAIAAVRQGHDLVLEGPPGTGKSQTITNLIAQALAEGKSVLFVAEKMAALQVVHTRLAAAGLGELCLELHSSKASKRAVLKEIATALDATLQRPPALEPAGRRLAEVRRELNEYVQAVHTPRGALAISPYEAYGGLGTVLGAPKVRLAADVDGLTREQVEAAERDLEALAELAKETGDPARHPWRDTTRTFYSEDDLDAAAGLLADLRSRLDAIARAAVEVSESLSLPPIRTFAEIDTAAAIADVLGRSPGAPLQVLESAEWNAPPPLAEELVRRGRKLAELRQRAESRFTPEALEVDHGADADYVEQKEASFLRFLSFLDSRYRVLKKRWTAYRQPGYSPSMAEQVAEMREIDALRRERQHLQAQDAAARQLFGGLWRGEHSAWDALEGYIRWVVELRSVCVAHGLRERALEAASRPQPDISKAVALRDAAAQAKGVLAGLRQQVGWPADYLATSPLAETAERLRALADNLRQAHRWAAFEQARARVTAGPAAEMLEPAFRGEVAFADLAAAFRRAFFQKWLSAAVQEREPLRAFHALTHERRIEEFRRLDRRVLEENRVNLLRRLRDRAQERLRTAEAQAGLPFLQREMKKQRAHSPLRRTMKQAEAAIRAIKPCFLMSPLTVAQLLDGKSPSFDLVVFDEASQLPPEDALGAIARGRQLVVVGDPKQLPPTNFFAVMAGQVEAPAGEDGSPLVEDGESILESFSGSGVPSARLLWHYRSTHESLITFSNVSFYDAGLQTFPSVETDSHAQGLQLEYVEGGVYEGKGINPVESSRVAEAVMRHAKETPELSLGVGTFSLRQQFRILEDLENLRRQDPSAEAFFAPREQGGFFVKNLENVQGDERDVIFLSVTYGRSPDGKIRHHFGPLNGENGWRRLNVLTTRARKRMRVFSSIHGDEINAAQTTARGARLLRDFLLYAEHGRLDVGVPEAADGDAHARLERDVHAELTARGIRLEPRVGVAGYRIDFGVLDDAAPGRYLCGIECDGPAYRKAETARDRDRLRQEVLAARGWTIHRVWSTDWFKDREGQVERLLGLIEGSRKEAQEEAAAEAEARAKQEAQATAHQAETQAQAGGGALSQASEPAQKELFANRFTGRYERAEQIPQQELRAAVKAVLAATEGGLDRTELTNQVRALFGFGRTGPRIKAAVGTAIDALLAAGVLGEGSTGIRLREPETTAPG